MTPEIQSYPKIKVCGTTRLEDAKLAMKLGAEYIGFIFAGGTPREVNAEDVEKIILELKEEFGSGLKPIGVFLDEKPGEIYDVAKTLGLSAVQLHQEKPKILFNPLLNELREEGIPVIPALGVGESQDLENFEWILSELKNHRDHPEFPEVLFDTSVKGKTGGTGKVFDHELILPFLKDHRIMVAGGLGPVNIGEILTKFQSYGAGYPYAFDLSSGLEAEKRIKSPEKMVKFFDIFRESLKK